MNATPSAGLAALALALCLGGCALSPPTPDDDAPGPRIASGTVHPPDYAEARRVWRSPAQLNTWIGDAFEYDRERAMRLSETQRQALGSLPIPEPAAFYARPAGICVDLARFAVETLRAISPETKPRYLLLEFDPATIQGNVLRRHWVAVFERDGALYVFADSKRPGHLAGPYARTGDFIAEYASWRGRGIVAWQERDSWQRRVRAKAAAKAGAGMSRGGQ